MKKREKGVDRVNAAYGKTIITFKCVSSVRRWPRENAAARNRVGYRPQLAGLVFPREPENRPLHEAVVRERAVFHPPDFRVNRRVPALVAPPFQRGPARLSAPQPHHVVSVGKSLDLGKYFSRRMANPAREKCIIPPEFSDAFRRR